MMKSLFIFTCVDQSPLHILCIMCDNHTSFYHVLIVLLHHKIGTWTATQKQKANALENMPYVHGDIANKFVAAIREQNRRLDCFSNESIFMFEGNVNVTTNKKNNTNSKNTHTRKTNNVKKIIEDDFKNTKENDAEELTHKSLLDRLSRKYQSSGFKFTLVGSGIFSNTSDMDVVVSVPNSTSLMDAYDIVLKTTCWTPCYEYMTGERVAVITGIFEGVAVDCQVWRGENNVSSKSEEMTLSAIHLSNKIETETCKVTRNCARLLHMWFLSSGFKGHQLCRLPGVAITCLAIMLSCRNDGKPTIQYMLSLLRDTLTCSCPTVEFETLSFFSHGMKAVSPRRCTSPFSVIVAGRNCATRISLSISRHLLDTVAFSLSLPLTDYFTQGVYQKWRERTMFRCALMKPLRRDTISHTLATVAKRLDGHPLIDTLYFQEEGSNILVLCSINSQADVSRYGIRKSDVINLDENGRICIRRNTTNYWLLQSPHKTGVTLHSSSLSLVNDTLWIEGMKNGWSFPNAPCLACDVVTHFDHRCWVSV